MTSTKKSPRLLFSLAGAILGGALVSFVESRSVVIADAGAHAPKAAAVALADFGVLAPMAFAVGMSALAVSLFFEPDRPVSIFERVAQLRAEPVFSRCHNAALLAIAPFLTALWMVATAQFARAILSRGSPMAAGMSLAIAATWLLVVFAACGLALLPGVRRGLASAAFAWPRAIDPVVTGGIGLALGVLVLATGALVGDAGGGGPSLLAIFGVLRRSELDLRPVIELGVMGLSALLLPPYAMSGPTRSRAPFRLLAGVGLIIASAFATAFEAGALNRAPAVARSIESHAPLGRIALALVRKATDRDHDGASPYFGGGDCNDHDPNISPLAIDIPGNGIDEDCSGADMPAAKAVAAQDSAQAARPQAFHDLNLILITIDTLRATETGFLGYDKPTTPNLDVLAKDAVVFERAYAMASYTGKALGPMLIGKYPSETRRDGGHFNKYFAANTFLAERLQTAGIYTMGAASHWYFRDSWGLTQGFDTFDLSAAPKSGQGETDTSITSPQLTDAAIKLLNAHAGSQRFFLWVHYFDPHAQYVPHPEAPDFSDPAKGPGFRMRALYDGEVWFTDNAIGRLLDFVRAASWGKNTAIVVTSDHGEAMNEHGIAFQHGFEIWEPLMRVPLVMAVPGVRPHHVPVKRSAVDIVPTLLDVMGIARPPAGELSGRSLADDLLGAPDAAYEERDVYMDMPDGPYTHLRRGLIHGATPGMKLIHFGGRQYQLYDLQNDPGETDDLAGDVARLAPILNVFQAKRATLREIEVKPDTASFP